MQFKILLDFRKYQSQSALCALQFGNRSERTDTQVASLHPHNLCSQTVMSAKSWSMSSGSGP